jgi:hypothetical protein
MAGVEQDEKEENRIAGSSPNGRLDLESTAELRSPDSRGRLSPRKALSSPATMVAALCIGLAAAREDRG